MKNLLLFLLIFSAQFFAPADAADDQSPFKSEIIGGTWSGLNNADASIQILDNEAQDLINVDITNNGYGVKKRSGYDQFRTIGLSTHGVRGGHYFRDVDGNDTLIYCNEMDCFESVNSAAFSSFLTTDTVGSYYDWTDANGSAWRANNSRNEICSYSGSALTYYPALPKGDQIEFMPNRGAISGTAANPNRINYSEEADFTNYTAGNNDTDPWADDIGLPGSVVTAMKYALGRLFVWTRTSVLYGFGTNQFDWEYKDLSTTIGTTQPNSVVYDQGIVYWQGQDSHFYATDGEEIRWISRKLDVSNIVNLSGSAKIWTQTTESDWEDGTLGTDISANASSGDIRFSTSGVQFDVFGDSDYTANPAWTLFDVANATASAINSKLQITDQGDPNSAGIYASITNSTGAWSFVFLSTDSGSSDFYFYLSSATSSDADTRSDKSYVFRFNEISDGTFTITIYENGTSLATTSAASSIFDSANHTIKIERNSSGLFTVFIDGTSVLTATDTTTPNLTYLGFVQPDSGPTAAYGTANVDDIYFQWHSSSFTSQSNNVGSSISSWGVFTANHALNDGTIAYAIYGDTDSSTNVNNGASFTSSQTITSGEIPSIAVAAYVVVGATFTRTSSTQTPTVNDFSLEWFDGTTRRHFGSVDKDHRIQWSVIEGTATVPNKTYIYDTRFDTWLKYDIPFDAAVTVGDTLYFGGVSTGVVYQYPSGNTDDGSAITAYWKSKDFTSGNIFSEKVYKSISIVPKRQTGSNLDIDYTVNTSSTSTYNISLTDADGNSFVRNNYWLPSGRRGSFFNIKFGNNDGDAPFEVYVLRYEYDPLPWRKMP